MEGQALTVQKHEVVDISDYAMSVDAVVRQVGQIHKIMEKVLILDEHYGTIPGCKKPSLYKPGAEKLSLVFRLAPSYEITRTDLPNSHREYQIRCIVTHLPSGQIFSQGVGSCSTMEGKYRFRNAEKKCPKCGKEAIIKGKAEFGGGWLCFKKKDGCGAKWNDGDPVIEDQTDGKIEHDNPADYYNTILKMAKKRAHIDAVLTATAASDIFTQDVEDMDQNGESFGKPPKPGKAPKKDKSQAGTQTTIDDLLRKKLKEDGIDETHFCRCAKVQTLEDFSANQVTVMLKLWPQTSAKFYTWQAAQKRQAEDAKEAAGQGQGAEANQTKGYVDAVKGRVVETHDIDFTPPDGPSVSDTEPSYFKREFDGLRSTFQGKLIHHINSGMIKEATAEDIRALHKKWASSKETMDKPFPLDEKAKPGIEGDPAVPIEADPQDNGTTHGQKETLRAIMETENLSTKEQADFYHWAMGSHTSAKQAQKVIDDFDDLLEKFRGKPPVDAGEDVAV